jgi:CHASE2 domain-containing sensor protein
MSEQESYQELPIPEISKTAILCIAESVDKELSWDNDKYQVLTMQLFQTWQWGLLNKDILDFKINFSPLSGGRSAVKVFQLTFDGRVEDGSGRTATYVLRIHPNDTEANQERKNADKLDLQSDCFPNLVEIDKEKRIFSNIVVYRHVIDNKGGASFHILNQALSSLPTSQIKFFANNFSDFIKQVTIQYEKVKPQKNYEAVPSSQYCHCQNILSQLPPDLLVKKAYLYDISSQSLVIRTHDEEEFFHSNPNQIKILSLFDVFNQLRESQSLTHSQWIKIKEPLQFEEKNAPTSDSHTHYLPFFIETKDNQHIRLWIAVNKEKYADLKLTANQPYELILFESDIILFTTHLEKIGFDSAGCLLNFDFQKLCNQISLKNLHLDMRHNDLHCGNVLVSENTFKLIDLSDMDWELIANDRARLEVSLWFEISKNDNQLSYELAQQILHHLSLRKAEQTLSQILLGLKRGFKDGVQEQPRLIEVELAYVIQILLYQRYCLLDEVKIPPAFNAFACHWINRFQKTASDNNKSITEIEWERQNQKQDRKQRRYKVGKISLLSVLGISVIMSIFLWTYLVDFLRLDTLSDMGTMYFGDKWLVEKTFSDDILMVPISPETINIFKDEVGEFSKRWRKKHAELINQLSQAGAKIVVFDMYFRYTGPFDEIFVDAVRQANQRGTAVVIGVREFEGDEDTLKTRNALEQAGSHLGVLCVGKKLFESVSTSTLILVKKNDELHSALALKAFEVFQGKKVVAIDQKNQTIIFNNHEIKPLPFSELQTVTSNQSHCSATGDGDHVAEILLNLSPREILDNPKRRYDYHKIIQANVDELKQFKDKIVIVGVTSEVIIEESFKVYLGLEERHGFELHADALNLLLNGNIIRKLAYNYQLIIIILVALLGFAIRFLLPQTQKYWLIGLIFVVLLIVGINLFCYSAYYILLNPTYYIGTFVITYWMIGKIERRWFPANKP